MDTEETGEQIADKLLEDVLLRDTKWEILIVVKNQCLVGL